MRWLGGIINTMDEFEQTPGDSEGQGSLACCIPRSGKESDMTELLSIQDNILIIGGVNFMHPEGFPRRRYSNVGVCGGGMVTKLCPTLTAPWTLAHQAPLYMGFPRQEHWNGLPFPPPGGLPDPGTEPRSKWVLHSRQPLYQLSQQGSPMWEFSKPQ